MSETRKETVREALVRVIRNYGPSSVVWDLAEALGIDADNDTDGDAERIADALLARVPAEGVTAEPVAWMMERDTPRAHSLRFTCDETEAQHESRRGYQVTPLYASATPPAAETGEVTEAMVAYARGFLDSALKAMTHNVHGEPVSSMYVEDCVKKARAALAASRREGSA